MATVDHIAQLIPDPKNARRHNPRNVGMIADALNEVGAARSIVIDEDNVVLAGNATIEAAAQAGITRVVEVEADGNTIIAVRRRGLDKKQKKRLALYDNRAAELAEWEPTVLEEDRDILDGLFRDDEVARLLGELSEVDTAGLWQGMPEFEQETISDKYKSLIVHFETQEDYEAFSRLIDQTLTEKSNYIWFPYKPTHGVPGSMKRYRVADES